MAGVDGASLPGQFEDANARIDALRAAGKVPAETDAGRTCPSRLAKHTWIQTPEVGAIQTYSNNFFPLAYGWNAGSPYLAVRIRLAEAEASVAYIHQ